MMRIVAALFVTGACANYGAVPPDATPQSETLGSLSDPCDGNATLTGQQALSILEPSYSATFTRNTPNGSGAPSALALAVAYNGGTITCHPARHSIGSDPDEPASLDLAVHASISTSDGLFDESFDGTVSTGTASSVLDLDGKVAIADLRGTFVPEIPGTWQAHDVEFGGPLVAGTTTGAVVEQASKGDFGETHIAGGWQ